MATLTLVTQPSSKLTKKQTSHDTFDTADNVFNAHAETKSLTLDGLPEILNNIGSDQALILGTTESAPCIIITNDAKQKGSKGITRTKENFVFSEKTSLMLLDIDFHQYSNPVDPITMLTGILNPFGYVIRGSTTAGITSFDDEHLSNGKGCHIYVEVGKGTDIPQNIELIHQRLILAGYGFVFVSKAGTSEIRTPVDVKVGSPERIIFEADPVLLPGYTQNRSAKHFAGGLLQVSTLSGEQQAKIKRLEQALLTEAQPRVDAEKKKWRNLRGLTEQAADRLFETKILPPDYRLTKTDNTEFTVSNVWHAPDIYNGLSIRDPIEPEYGKNKAKIYVNRNKDNKINSIVINSMAHGAGNKYLLKQPEGVMFAGVNVDTTNPPSAIERISKFSLRGKSEDMKKSMLEEVYILNGLALAGQHTVFYAPPNAGKTLLTAWLLIESKKNRTLTNHRVFYINADDTYTGLMDKIERFDKYNIDVIAPGHNGFKSNMFAEFINSICDNEEAKNIVFVLDTVKKFTSLMDKKIASEFGNLMREFSSKGGTVISLAHVNKHKNAEGMNVHAGTTDLKDDADCVYIIDVIADQNSTRAVEFTNSKSRGNVKQKVSYQYSTGESISYQDVFDSVKQINNTDSVKREYSKYQSSVDNEEIISAIKKQISNGTTHKTELIKKAAEMSGATKTNVEKVLKKHTGNSFMEHDYWFYKAGDKHSFIYQLNELPVPPELSISFI